ncbi:DUF5000 domain-containing lipoprotein [Chitinophaga arvensicola]|uniref:F5/8 type C domain-containing protein n=1 Tax=Chitinophaga arvensicola TaxID=29529 RepID=A0A1I0S7W6_9BACT|nr:DUF5000 domain-containing lipoprotein [Chitinophaga arvensicola]SEW51854.1 protein of unknown function [Chitinophaga arvensicola]
MKILLPILAGIILLTGSSGCKEEARLDHFNGALDAPAQVTNVQVTSTPGGAFLTYDIPKDPKLSYVKAVYEIQEGVKEAKASIYTDTLTLAGYGDTSLHEVKIYSVGRNEKMSQPVVVKLKPKVAPVYTSFDSLKLDAAFGGVKIRFQNPLAANLAVVLMADTLNNGVWIPLNTFYTKAPAGVFSYRGLPAKNMKFAVYLRDRWNNKSEMLVRSLTPLFEEKVPKPFKALILPSDETIPVEAGYPMERMWDDKVDQGIFATRHNSATPQWFTIDLGTKIVISRMKMHQRGESYTYTGSNVKAFELWGSNEPDADGSWSKWTLLGSFKSYKPSGLPLGKTTAEDFDYGHTKGEDFDMPDIPKAYRYYRFKTLATYGGGPQITIAELSFWGQIK